MSGAKTYYEEIPKGFQILTNTTIAGLNHRKEDAIKFIQSTNQKLTISEEPNNPYDKNAIAIYGTCSSGTYHLGYVDRDLALNIKEDEIFYYLIPRLTRTWLGDYGGIDIQYQLLISKSKLKELKEKASKAPPSAHLKEQAKFLNLTIKGKNTQELEQEINNFLRSHAEEKAEWIAYQSLIDNFTDLTPTEFEDEYDYKKPYKKDFVRALQEWKSGGKSLRQLECDHNLFLLLISKISQPVLPAYEHIEKADKNTTPISQNNYVFNNNPQKTYINLNGSTQDNKDNNNGCLILLVIATVILISCIIVFI